MFLEFALIGPTACGKSAITNALARKYEAIVLSLDSLSVYKEINIASAKPTKAEIKDIAYFGLDLISVAEHFSVADFFKEYKRAKKRAKEAKRPLIISGGSSFYLAMLLQGLSPKLKEAKSYPSNEKILALIKKIDKNSKINENDSYRLKKWYDIYANGEIPSEFLQKSLKKALIKKLDIFCIELEKNELLKAIAKRVDTMLELGLLKEADELFASFDPSLKALNSIGLKESKLFLDGLINKEKLKELICTHTAQLAKKQRSFNKKFISKNIAKKKALDELSFYLEKTLS